MPRFLFVYHGGKKPETPEEGEKAMAAWSKWFEDMGAAVVDGGNPVGLSHTVASGGVETNGGANPVAGYSVIEAADQGAATAHAKGCPMLADGGTVEVAEIINLM